MKLIDIEWTGPYTLENLRELMNEETDYEIYQVYGKHPLYKFDTLRLQKTAFYMDIFSGNQYFNFVRHKFGPYDNSISIISRNIRISEIPRR